MLHKSEQAFGRDAVISPEELAALMFSSQDVFLLTDSSQIEFLSARTNSSFEQCLLLPLSLRAYAASIQVHQRVRSYFDLIDFEKCKLDYRSTAGRLARAWLSELGLRFDIEGIDVAQLDAPSQFLLFLLGTYLERAVSAIHATLPDIYSFHVVCSERPFPLEFYFDSDVPVAIVQFALEQRGRRVRRILCDDRKLVFPVYPKRPFTCSADGDSTPANEPDSPPHKANVGFCYANVVNVQQILRELQALNRQVILFRSTWGGSLVFSDQYDQIGRAHV